MEPEVLLGCLFSAYELNLYKTFPAKYGEQSHPLVYKSSDTNDGWSPYLSMHRDIK